MQTRRLGNSDLYITPLGGGGGDWGGAGWPSSWSNQDAAATISAIHAALDAGMNWVDTAAVYGLGHSEEVVAKALEGRANRSYVFTKCGRVWDENLEVGVSLKADSVRRECEAGLRRLKVDVIDLYQIHWPEPDEEVEEGWATLARLKEEGKVRWIGVSNFNLDQLKRAQAVAPITSLQPQYSLISREVEEDVLPYCAEQNMGVIAYSPMGSELLTGTMTRERIAGLPEDYWRRVGPQLEEPLVTRNLKIADQAEGDRRPPRPRRRRGRHRVGFAKQCGNGRDRLMRSREQVAGVIGAMDFRLSGDEVNEIEAFVQRLG